MVSNINPTKPADGVPAEKSDLRANFAAAKSEIEILQALAIPTEETRDPNASDDSSTGKVRGSRWINTATPSLWECANPQTGSAQWRQIDGSGGGAGLTPVSDENASISIGSGTDGTIRFCTNAAPTATVLANCPAGTHVRLERAGGVITVNWQGPQGAGAGARFFTADDHGDTPSNSSFTCRDFVEFWGVSNTDGDSAIVEVEGAGLSLPSRVSGPVDFDGQAVSGNLVPVVTRGAGSAQPNTTTAADGSAISDSGKTIRTDGIVVIPNAAGWSCRLRIGADTHDIQHNAKTLDISVIGFAAGELYTVDSLSSTEIFVSGPAGQFTEADFAS